MQEGQRESSGLKGGELKEKKREGLSELKVKDHKSAEKVPKKSSTNEC